MVDDHLRQPDCFEMNSTIKLYVCTLLIAFVAFVETSIVIRIGQATAPAAPAKVTVSQPAATDKI
jgi:hypothetical protein